MYDCSCISGAYIRERVHVGPTNGIKNLCLFLLTNIRASVAEYL